MVAIGYVSPIPNDPTKVLKAGDTMTGDLLLSGSGTDLTVDGTTTVNYGSMTMNAGRALSTAISSGVISGGIISPSITPGSLDISPLVGYVIDYVTNPLNPSLVIVNQAAKTVAMDAGSLARVVTWWVMDSVGNVSQQGTPPTDTQRRVSIPLGITTQVGGVVVSASTLSVNLPQGFNQVYDLIHSLGPFSILGNFISPNGANLSFNKTSGTIFSMNSSRVDTPNDPHVNDVAAQTPVQFRRITQGAGGGLPALVTTIDPTMYDVGGVLTPVPNPNDATIQRIWMIGSNTVTSQIVVQYGQAVYPNITNALDRVGSEPYVVTPIILETAALLGYIVVTKSATALNNSAQAVIIQAGKFQRS